MSRPRAVEVLLEGLIADGQIRSAGEVVEVPGPQLLALADPDELHWTGVRAAKFAKAKRLAETVAIPQPAKKREEAPVPAVVAEQVADEPSSEPKE